MCQTVQLWSNQNRKLSHGGLGQRQAIARAIIVF